MYPNKLTKNTTRKNVPPPHVPPLHIPPPHDDEAASVRFTRYCSRTRTAYPGKQIYIWYVVCMQYNNIPVTVSTIVERYRSLEHVEVINHVFCSSIIDVLVRTSSTWYCALLVASPPVETAVSRCFPIQIYIHIQIQYVLRSVFSKPFTPVSSRGRLNLMGKPKPENKTGFPFSV